MIPSIALATLLTIAAMGSTVSATTSAPLKWNPPSSISSELQTLSLAPGVLAPRDTAAPTAAIAGPRLPDHHPLVANNAEGWFNKNAKTIAIVAVAVVLVLIITN